MAVKEKVKLERIASDGDNAYSAAAFRRRHAIAVAVPFVAAFMVLAAALAIHCCQGLSWQQVSNVSVDPPGASSSTSGVMMIGGPLLALWAASLYIRCSDLRIRRILTCIAALSALWMLIVLVKYAVYTEFLAWFLWYSYYVPMGFIPLLCFFAALRMAAFNDAAALRILRIALAVITLALVVLVFTNNLHHWVFQFDFANPHWPGDYSYGWGYWAFLVWTYALYAAFFGLLIRIAHYRLRKFFLPVAFLGILAVCYGLLYAFRVGNLFAGNPSLTYAIMVALCLELLMQFGLLPSFKEYRQVFARLPFDVKVLSNQLDVFYKTEASAELQDRERAELERFVRQGQQVWLFRIPDKPDFSYQVVRQRGSIALFTEDRSAVNARRRKLERTQETLKAHISLLSKSLPVERQLYRLASERRLLDVIDGHLGSTVDVIRDLLDNVPSGPEARGSRRRTLVFVRLLVGYCKRMGSFVLADAAKEEFDRQHLMLVMGDTAADARASGIECAAFVNADFSLSKQSLIILYDCMYNMLMIAFCYDDAVVMFSVLEKGDDLVEFGAVLEADSQGGLAESDLAHQLRASLAAQGVAYHLFSEDDALHLTVDLPRWASAGQTGEGAGACEGGLGDDLNEALCQEGRA